MLRNVNVELQDGRLYTEFDDLHRRDVAVIGSDVMMRFFEGEDPIGKVIQVDGHSFEVIGTSISARPFRVITATMDHLHTLLHLSQDLSQCQGELRHRRGVPGKGRTMVMCVYWFGSGPLLISITV